MLNRDGHDFVFVFNRLLLISEKVLIAVRTARRFHPEISERVNNEVVGKTSCP